MVDPDAVPTIVVYSASSAGPSLAAALVREIRAYPAPAAPAGGEPEANLTELWQIRNKYYSAWVKFKSHQVVARQDHDAPAVIVVASRSEPPSPDLQDQLAVLAARDPEFDVALLVSYTPPSVNATPSAAAPEAVQLDDEAWEDLAFAHGFEWVDVNPRAGEDANAEDDAPEGSGLEEAGVGRVVAALHAHLWDNMERAAKPAVRDAGSDVEAATRDELELVSEGEDEEEFASLGAPPLPEPRPFVPIPVAFPTTMLPSLSRKGPGSAAQPGPETFSSPAGESAASHRSAPSSAFATISTPFEDDFAPFVPPTSSFDPSDFVAPPSGAPNGLAPGQDGFELLQDDDDLGHGGDEGDEGEFELEGDGDELSELVAKLKGMRDEARGLGLEERRAVAERAVLGLLGES